VKWGVVGGYQFYSTTKVILKACEGVGGWFAYFCQMSGWYVCVRVPVLSSG